MTECPIAFALFIYICTCVGMAIVYMNHKSGQRAANRYVPCTSSILELAIYIVGNFYACMNCQYI